MTICPRCSYHAGNSSFCGGCGLPFAAGAAYPQPGVWSQAGKVDAYAWAQNPQASTPTVAIPLPLAIYSEPERQLKFRDPFAAGVPAIYSSNALGEVGSNNPLNVAYSRRVWRRSIWTSPVFDLRPELRSLPNTQDGMPLNRVGALGQGARLLLRLRRGATENNQEGTYNYQSVETVSVGERKLTEFQASAPTSITAAVQASPIVADTDTTSTLLVFAPPGNPVRFWQVMVVVDIPANDTVAEDEPAAHYISAWAG